MNPLLAWTLIGAAMLALKLFWMTGPSSRGGVE